MVSQDIMIKFLKKSETKTIILKKIFEEPYYLRELSKSMGIFPSGLLKHMRFLEKEGLIRSEEVGRKKFYKLTNNGLEILKKLE
ncbi:MAG: winged helix-turn-helix transcriptional regulator [Candidatus Aenigmarchaeota archaeon]|nr:winged helix-turn-helix transcriptional regulator [Candidatus Aenigmarchaeota archaeon]